MRSSKGDNEDELGLYEDGAYETRVQLSLQITRRGVSRNPAFLLAQPAEAEVAGCISNVGNSWS